MILRGSGGGGIVGIAAGDFQGLWEGWKTVVSFSMLSSRPSIPPPLPGAVILKRHAVLWPVAKLART
jgi:hypothetical protein